MFLQECVCFQGFFSAEVEYVGLYGSSVGYCWGCVVLVCVVHIIGVTIVFVVFLMGLAFVGLFWVASDVMLWTVHYVP